MRAIQGFEAQLVERQLQWLSYLPTKVALIFHLFHILCICVFVQLCICVFVYCILYVERQLQWLSYFPTKVALTANCTLLLLEVTYFTFWWNIS